MWSSPPVWISNVSPSSFMDMAEHSMCQPGKPMPQGEGHSCCLCSLGSENFQRAKSVLFFFSPIETRSPAWRPSFLRRARAP